MKIAPMNSENFKKKPDSKNKKKITLKTIHKFIHYLTAGEPNAGRLARWVREEAIARNLVADFHEKITGVNYSEILAQIHFWTFFVGVNLTFFPMHWLGVAGMPRRIPSYPDAFYLFNKVASWGSYISGISFVFFFFVMFEAFYSNRQNVSL